MVDQNSQFYAILTNVGAAKQANADALGIPWKITQMAVGDANGTDPTPNASQTSLLNEWRRAPLNQLKVDDKDASIIVAEQVIPADIGGRWIREIGLYDTDGDLVAVANCAPTYKPLLSQGSGRTQIVRMNLVVSSSSNVQLKIDPSVVLATREFVTEELAKQDFKHSVLVATTGPIVLSGLQTIDAVVLPAGATVLVKDQVAAKDNGLYVVAAGAWTRRADADTSAKVTPGLLVHVEKGAINGDGVWQLVTDGPINLGVSALAFEMAFGRTGVADGTYRSVSVDKYGRVVGATNPTTVAGYGLTDVYTKAQIDQALALKAPLASPDFAGTPKAPTAAPGTNTLQLANTAFVQAALAALVASSPAALDTLSELATALGNDPNFATTMLNALAGKAPLASPALTGIPTGPTAAPGTNTLQLATTAFVAALGALKANLASPAFTGIPTAPTAAPGTNTLQLATTAFVQAAVAALVDSSPAALDTLNELAAALGDDPNFAVTITNALAGKADKATTLSGYGILNGLTINKLLGGTNLNTLGDSNTHQGSYVCKAGADALASLNYPAQEAGNLVVGAGAWGCLQEYTTNSNRKFCRSLTGAFTGTGPWTDWAEITVQQATENRAGIAKIATLALLLDGADNESMITAKLLKLGCAYSLTANGYIAAPRWLGGFILQWGVTGNINADSSIWVSWPLEFPNACLCVQSIGINATSSTTRDNVPQIVSYSKTALQLRANGVSSTTDTAPQIWFSLGF